MNFKDKVILVTGGSRGIGRATAAEFAKTGARVAINYLSSTDQAESFVRQHGAVAMAVKADVSDKSSVEAMVQQVVDAFGHIDVLVNNAGIVFDVAFQDGTVEEWRRTFDVNVLGTFLCSRACLPHFPSHGGAIVNLSSTSGINIFTPESMAYDSTKAGIAAITRSLAREMAPRNIRVNAVAPGWVDTDMNRNLPADVIADSIQKIYLKRMAEPFEIAKAIMFLASDEASFVNGTTLVVDGGYG